MADLLAVLAGLGHHGSRLAVSFERGFERQPVTRLVARAVYRRSGETTYFRLRAEDAPSFLDRAGWTVDWLLTAADLRAEYLDGTSMALQETAAFIAAATPAPARSRRG